MPESYIHGHLGGSRTVSIESARRRDACIRRGLSLPGSLSRRASGAREGTIRKREARALRWFNAGTDNRRRIERYRIVPCGLELQSMQSIQSDGRRFDPVVSFLCTDHGPDSAKERADMQCHLV